MKKYIGIMVVIFTVSVSAGGDKAVHSSANRDIGVITRMNINNIDLPLINDGSTGNDGQAYYPNGQTSLSFLFSGGFAACGYVSGQLRASWMAPASLLEEWIPGKWGMDPNDPLATFYEVSRWDGFGSQAYVDWADAVSLGAQFIDLNGDGIYDPNVDRPPVIGDKIIWTVFNDSTVRAYPGGLGTQPLGLEIQQMVWAYARQDLLGDVIFFWHRLINAGGSPIDSLIFSVLADADIGDYTDDLVGCDTTSKIGYCYNDGDDLNYGSNPPAFGIQLLQGAVINSPGDTAFVYGGPSAGVDTLYNSRKLTMTSFMYYIGGAPNIGDPRNTQTARYYQEGGKDSQGNPINPTQWGVGGTPSTDPRFFYSGDPVTATGWRDNVPADKRYMVNCGPFDMAPGDTQDVVFAYVVTQGSNHLNSIVKMRQAAGLLDDIFPDSSIIVSIHEKSVATGIPQSFNLLQNYPNPFNPNTVIRWQLPVGSEVELTIYNLLGQKIRTLVNRRQPAGAHQVEWDGGDDAGSEVASGVYIYRIKAGDFVQSRKMVVIR